MVVFQINLRSLIGDRINKTINQERQHKKKKIDFIGKQMNMFLLHGKNYRRQQLVLNLASRNEILILRWTLR